MSKEKVMDMTQGPVLMQMSLFALPVLLGMLCQRIYNFADTYIVGKYLGDEALAAVSISGTAMYLLFSIMMGVTTGISVVISQFYGAHREQEIQRTFAAGTYVAIGTTIILTIIGIVTVQPLLRVLQTSEELLPAAANYLVIIYAGCAATMLYNFSSSVLRALGNSVVPLIFLIVSSVLNVFLDILLVAWIPLGTAGAALATVLAQFISGALCIAYTWKIIPFLRMSRKEWKLDRYLAGQILRYGIPTGLQMSIISISDMTLQAVVNTYGTTMVVAYGVCMKVEGLGFQLAEAIGSAVGTFTGQNVGAKNFVRIRKGVRSAYLMNIICYGIFCPLVFAFARPIMAAFTQTPDAIRFGVEYMRIFTIFFLAGGILVVYHNILRASGDVAVTVLMGVSEVITRIGCALLLPMLWGYRGLWMVSPITWICAMLVGAVRYYSGTWQKKAENMHIQSNTNTPTVQPATDRYEQKRKGEEA